jgi:hypothetical protein
MSVPPPDRSVNITVFNRSSVNILLWGLTSPAGGRPVQPDECVPCGWYWEDARGDVDDWRFAITMGSADHKKIEFSLLGYAVQVKRGDYGASEPEYLRNKTLKFPLTAQEPGDLWIEIYDNADFWIRRAEYDFANAPTVIKMEVTTFHPLDTAVQTLINQPIVDSTGAAGGFARLVPGTHNIKVKGVADLKFKITSSDATKSYRPLAVLLKRVLPGTTPTPAPANPVNPGNSGNSSTGRRARPPRWRRPDGTPLDSGWDTFDSVRIEDDSITIRDNHSTRDAYKYFIMVQEANSGQIGLIDPEIENEAPDAT